MEYKSYCLKNGIRLIHKKTNSPVANCAIFINTGSRDERENEQGLAHLIEHMIFKGTKKRKAYHILSRIDEVGGEIDAYTSKEEIVIMASFLNEYYERSFELIYDIVFNSTFPEKELIKEKEVIIDELNSYKDNPSEQIFDDFEELLFNNHPIGKNILGTKKSIKLFNQNNLNNFLKRTLNTDEIVISSVGNISFNEIKNLFIKYFDRVSENKRNWKREAFNNYKPTYKKVLGPFHQSHCIIGNIGYNMFNDKRAELILLNNLFGGPGMNSRLNLNIREKHGFTYNIESNYTAYTDTGAWSLYFGTDKDYLENIIELVYKEFEKLKSKKLGPIQFKKAQNQIIGQIAISQASNMNEMLSMGKSYMLFNKVDTLEEVKENIYKITPESLMDIANEIFDKSTLSTLIYKTDNKINDYD